MDHLHRNAAYVAQMLRVSLFGASNLKSDHSELIQPLPELFGPLYDYSKQFKIALQAELNAPATARGSATLLSFARSVDEQIEDITERTELSLFLSYRRASYGAVGPSLR